MPVSAFTAKLDVSKIITKSSPSFKSFYYDIIIPKKYQSVTNTLSILSEGSNIRQHVSGIELSSWRQNIILNAYSKQIAFTQKRQPNRVFSDDDLQFMRRAAEGALGNELQRSGVMGNEIHTLITNLIAGDSIPEPSKFKEMIASYRLWRKAYDFTPYFTDVFVHSDEHHFCGFIDAVGMDSTGNIVIIDFKSGKGVYDQHAIQLAAYCKAFEETCLCKEPVRDAYILHLNQNSANFGFLKVDNIDKCFSLFRHCLELNELTKNPGKLLKSVNYDCLLEYLNGIYRRTHTYRLFIYGYKYRRRISFHRSGFHCLEFVDIAMYLWQQYPCLPCELEKTKERIYTSKREIQIVERTLMQRQSLIKALDQLQAATCSIKQFVILIGTTPLSIDSYISFLFSSSDDSENDTELSFSDILTLKKCITTSDIFSPKSEHCKRRVWIYLYAERDIELSEWVWDRRFDLPKKCQSWLQIELGNQQDTNDFCWYKCGSNVDGCPQLSIQ